MINEIITIIESIWDKIMSTSEVWLEILRLLFSWQVFTFVAFLVLRKHIIVLLKALAKKIPQATQIGSTSTFIVQGSTDAPNPNRAEENTVIDESEEG